MGMDHLTKSRLGALRRYELYGNPGTSEGRSKGGRKTGLLIKNNPDLAKSLGLIVRKTITCPNNLQNWRNL